MQKAMDSAATATDNTTMFHLEHICQEFRTSDGKSLKVLDDVNLVMKDYEIIALLGKSGAGKSTLLRIMAGLLPPSSGTILYRDQPIMGPTHGLAMVFQNFALLPWLTVLENVELGLEAQGVPKAERRKRALKAIDTIGLDGFESAFPKELSGGMRQRVGFARALVIEPECLLMDEPFSALDVLTAESLRNDLIDLWMEKRTKLKSILIVTHNIEEAVLLANRIFIFNSNPGKIRAELSVDTPLPRDPKQPYFRKLVDDIYTLMTSSEGDLVTRTAGRIKVPRTLDVSHRLPDVESSEIVGLIDGLWQGGGAPRGPIDLPLLAETLRIDNNRLLPIAETLEILGFAKIAQGDFSLTDIGAHFAAADILERKQIFAEQLIQHVPLAKHIRDMLASDPHHVKNEEVILKSLESSLSENEADRVLKVIIDWGRYAEIFAYDYDSGNLSFENPTEHV
ncbi:MAG: nitrate/sulfonate/bicarbonate ABC transporter ATP-binding protein [Pseudomonadota bacterium]